MMNAPQYWVLVLSASALFAASFAMPVLYMFFVGFPENGIRALALFVALFFLPQAVSILAMFKAKDLKATENFGEYND